MDMNHVLATQRLRIRRAQATDAEFIHTLWTTPEVMRFVGFPKGLSITIDEVREQIKSSPHSNFGSRLIAELYDTQVRIGQCKIGVPDADGICEPDIKLDPEFWGNGYGEELWKAMIDYAFENSPTSVVQGTPNRGNTASVRMQQGAGMIQVDEGVFEPSTTLHPQAISVPYCKFQITRNQWQSRRQMHSGKDSA